jgi:FkbM family methyltransferase
MMDSAPVHLAFKRLVLRSPLGRLAVGTRDAFKLAASAWAGDECVGTLANDQLASLLISGLCQSGARFLDVGAHIGSVVAEVLGRCPGTQVIAIEAMPDKAESLRRMFPGIAVHACAAGDHEGEVTFFVDRRQSGFSSLGRPPFTRNASVHEIRVPLRRLDDVVGLGAPSIDAMKIDVEGAELGVLRGADQLVERHRPTIMFESGPAMNDGLGYTKEALWAWFDERRYAILVPNRVAHLGAALGLEGFLESHLYPRRTTNYVAVAAERRAEIRARAQQLLGVANGA